MINFLIGIGIIASPILLTMAQWLAKAINKTDAKLSIIWEKPDYFGKKKQVFYIFLCFFFQFTKKSVILHYKIFVRHNF